jgi:hypothetical protein
MPWRVNMTAEGSQPTNARNGGLKHAPHVVGQSIKDDESDERGKCPISADGRAMRRGTSRCRR